MNRFAVVSLFASAAALAQGPGGPPPGRFGGEMHIMGMQGMKPGQVVTGSPFSGQEVTTETQTLANGTHITNTMTAQFYRDASGRTRVERTFSKVGPWSSGQPATMIDIFDPVAGARYSLNPAKQTGFKETVSAAPNGPRAQRAPRPNNGQVVTTSLGSQIIQGLSVTGTLTTRTIPAGQMGNDQPIVITDERWMSADLQMAVLTKHSDPRMGEVDFAMQNISRAAPDAALFAPPASYAITTRAGGRGRGAMQMAPPPPPPGLEQ